MPLIDPDRRLRLADGVDLRALPLTPEDAFVLSHLDGTASESDIALATGLEAEVIQASIAKLRGLGVLAEITTTRRSTPHPAAPRTTNSGTFHIGPVIETRSDSSGNHPAAALYDPVELDEQVDLDLPRKRKILDAYYRLGGLSHYELLAIDAGADKKAIKAAYFDLVNDFHPDRYFGKALGAFKPKLERLFARVTEAHDVLTRQAAREDYDRYLASVRKTEALDRTLADRGGHAREVERLKREIQEQVQLEEKARHSYPPPAGSASPLPLAIHPTPPPVPEHPSSMRPSDMERRRALARKLGVSMPPAPRTSSQPAPTPNIPSNASRDAATADLKRRYEERIGELKARQVQHYVTAAEEAERRKDLVSATNAFRIAASLAPEDTVLGGRLRDIETRAQAGLADSYLEQAKYEERENRWLEAAASYRRASRAKPSPRVLERVAFCLYTGKGDLKEAADFAKRARDGAPDDPTLRLTLGMIYLEAGMKQSALGEFERAQQLSPKDDSIKDWLRRARRSEA